MLRISRYDHPGLSKFPLNPVTSVLKRDRRSADTDRHAGERRPHEDRGRDGLSSCKPRNARSHQKLGEARAVPSLEPLTRARPCWHLDLGLIASSWVREYICVVTKHPVGGDKLQQP